MKKNKHALWTGSISFGLVNIPIQMYTASVDKDISFVLLHKKDLSQIRYARFCKAEDKEVPWSEIVKGYEYENGSYAVLDEKDFEKANPKKTKTIEIVSFADIEEIDSIYYVKPYFLEPGKNAGGAYNLLREALKKSGKLGIAKYVIRNHEHLGVIKVHEDMLILNQLRYKNELLSSKDLNIPALKKGNAKEIDVAVQLINHLTEPFKPEKYKDSFTEDIKKMIKAKKSRKPDKAPVKPLKSPKIHDMMDLLKESLKKGKKSA